MPDYPNWVNPDAGSRPPLTWPVYCSDEDLLVHASGDFAVLCPPWQQMAYGTDGAFASGSPWVLTSASVNFTSNGVNPNQVVWLTTPKSQYPGGGAFLAVDSTSGGSITLRRPYKDLNVGQPPAPAAGLTGVTFAINTLDPQIAEATYDLKQRYMIDDNPQVGNLRASSWIYDLQVLRVATVYSVLYERYCQEARTDRGDFKEKIVRYRQKLNDAISRVEVRWGPYGNSAEPATVFNCKLSR
jgi:hypothetical protein